MYKMEDTTMKSLKKILSVAAAAAVIASASASVIADDEIKVELDGSAIEFDVPPQIIEDRTLVPLRAIFEALGAEVEWDDATKTVSSQKAGTTVSMTIGVKEITVNGETVALDVPPQIVDDRTLVPVRAIAQSYSCKVDWDGESRTVIITTPEETTEPTATAEPEATAEPAAAPTEPALQPAGTDAPAASSELGIEYDGSNEGSEAGILNFKIEKVTKDADGKYVIDYSLETWLEGTGTVTGTFKCYDASGKEVDSFTGSYYTMAYTANAQSGTVTVSGDTVKIVFAGK